MNTKASVKKRPGLASALAASLEGERSHLDQRFAKAEEIFGDKPSEPVPEPKAVPEGGSIRPHEDRAAEPEPVEDEKVDRIGFSLLKKETHQLDAMFADAARQAPRTTVSEVIRAALTVFHRLPAEQRLKEIRTLEKPKLRRRRD